MDGLMAIPKLPEPSTADIVLRLPEPPSANRLWRIFRNRAVRSSDYRNWIVAAQDQCAYQSAAEKIKGWWRVRITLPPSRRDGDNSIKPVLDLLQRAGVVENDRDCQRGSWQIDRARETGSILVELWAMETPPVPAKKRRLQLRSAT